MRGYPKYVSFRFSKPFDLIEYVFIRERDGVAIHVHSARQQALKEFSLTLGQMKTICEAMIITRNQRMIISGGRK